MTTRADRQGRSLLIWPDRPREEIVDLRPLGKTGLKVSTLGFGCGAVGGLMIRGSPAEQDRAVARAVELGINYFDTAPMYGDGESERNLGRVLKISRPDVLVGTKVWIARSERTRIADAVTTSLEASLQRLKRDRIDLFQLHNPIAPGTDEDALDAQVVLEEVVPAFQRLRQQGKLRFCGLTALGDVPALHRVLDSRHFDTAQVVYNILNPSAGRDLPPNYPAQDFGQLFGHTSQAGMGVIGIRALAGGALSGAERRHPFGLPVVSPIGSGLDYQVDVRRASRFGPLVRDGYAAGLIEVALRFAIASRALSTVLVGYSSIEQLEHAAAAVNKGPFPSAVLEQIAELQNTLADEPG